MDTHAEPAPPTQLTARFASALELARRAHDGQLRKGTRIPYLSHPLAVAALVLEHGADEDEAIAALLHDVVEDGGGRDALDAIRAEFGDRVADIVLGCSDHVAEPGEVDRPKAEWRARKDAYLEHFLTADRSVLLVAAADKLHNARSIRDDYEVHGSLLWQRFTAGPADVLWYFRSLVAVLQESVEDQAPGATPDPTGYARLVLELRRVVGEIDLMTWPDQNA
ncbi:MAG: HD domain-containing protein [Actinobacteria bacterium]|nr:HD domain-containing protein [Actinomycetota bacterium]